LEWGGGGEVKRGRKQKKREIKLCWFVKKTPQLPFSNEVKKTGEKVKMRGKKKLVVVGSWPHFL